MKRTKFDRRLSENLWRLLDQRGMTQKTLSVLANVRPATISSYINGRSQPTLDKLRRIRAALGCTWDELLEGVKRNGD